MDFLTGSLPQGSAEHRPESTFELVAEESVWNKEAERGTVKGYRLDRFQPDLKRLLGNEFSGMLKAGLPNLDQIHVDNVRLIHHEPLEIKVMYEAFQHVLGIPRRDLACGNFRNLNSFRENDIQLIES